MFPSYKTRSDAWAALQACGLSEGLVYNKTSLDEMNSFIHTYLAEGNKLPDTVPQPDIPAEESEALFVPSDSSLMEIASATEVIPDTAVEPVRTAVEPVRTVVEPMPARTRQVPVVTLAEVLDNPESLPESAFDYANGPAPIANPDGGYQTFPVARGNEEILFIDPQTNRHWMQLEVPRSSIRHETAVRQVRFEQPKIRKATFEHVDEQGMRSIHTVEVPIQGVGQEASATIELPRWQVGKFKSPYLPEEFTVVCFEGREGFELKGVWEFFGGRENVPESVGEEIMIGNIQCYDIARVKRAVESLAQDLSMKNIIYSQLRGEM